MTTLDLKGKRALVTGSVQGIGLAIAIGLARSGADVALHGLPQPDVHAAAQAAVEAAGGRLPQTLTHDLPDGREVEPMMAAAPEAGPLDILVNNAGIQHTAALADMPRAKWDAILSVNLSAAFDTMRLALPDMVRRGYERIINVASVHGLVA